VSKYSSFGVGIGLAVLSAVAGTAQTHVVKDPETVVRAVAVYEWTGDLGKPTASRVVPVTIFINKELQDAGVYLARPVPFVLQKGTVFEVEKAGIPTGTVELSYARHLQTSEKPRIDDGWFAYGAFKPTAPTAPAVAAKKSGPLPTVVASGGTRPHFSTKPDDTPVADDKTRVDRSTAAGSGTTVSASKVDDPEDRKRDPDSDSAKDDPDRPTLKKRTAAQTREADKKRQLASVTGGTSLNDDPDRPNLHRGKPASNLDDQDLPPLTGIPADMHQMVAVSDAKDRPEHDFTRPWDSDAERQEVQRIMRAFAIDRLAAYARENALLPVTVAPKPAPTPRPTVRTKAAKPAKPVPAQPDMVLTSESLNAYTLSYGGSATYVYSASATTRSSAPQYVTIVAQREPDGSLKPALSTVTDDAHLDRTPQFRLVDVVDAESSNRASLLFELRGKTQRQFALYRVIGAHAEQTIAAGSAD
jgi:hypothetical protein